MNKIGAILLILALTMAIPLQGEAQAITLSIDKLLDDSGVLTGYDFGTISLLDNGDLVDISVDLNYSSGYFDEGNTAISLMVLNFDEGKLANADFSSDPAGLTFNLGQGVNTIPFGGYSFDLSITGDSLGAFSLGADTLDINPEDLLFTVGESLAIALQLDRVDIDGDGVFADSILVADDLVVPEPRPCFFLVRD